MDACDAVENELEKVLKKFIDTKGSTMETINEIVNTFSTLMKSLGKQ